MSCITVVAKRSFYGGLKTKPSFIIDCYCVLIKIVYYGGPLTATNAILAIIADGGRAFVDIDIEAGRN